MSSSRAHLSRRPVSRLTTALAVLTLVFGLATLVALVVSPGAGATSLLALAVAGVAGTVVSAARDRQPAR